MQVVELAPAFGLDDKVRQALHADALKIARHVRYRNAGTVEFMVDKNGDYFFLEVNPRIQVSYYITSVPHASPRPGHSAQHNVSLYICSDDTSQDPQTCAHL